MSFEILLSVIGGFITVIMGFLTTLLSERRRKHEKIEKQKIEDILAASEAQLESIKARVAESLIEKLPPGASSVEIAKQLSTQFRIGGDVVINQVVKESGGLIQDLVSGYHQQALSQAKVQFWFSIFAASIGFAYILFSATGVTINELSSLMRILPGVVIDAVAALFFRQAEQTRQRATELYDRLRKDSQLSMAQKLMETIEDPRIKSATQAQIALHMAGLEPKEIDLTKLIAVNSHTENKDS